MLDRHTDSELVETGTDPQVGICFLIRQEVVVILVEGLTGGSRGWGRCHLQCKDATAYGTVHVHGCGLRV